VWFQPYDSCLVETLVERIDCIRPVHKGRDQNRGTIDLNAYLEVVESTVLEARLHREGDFDRTLSI
jgi:hypothetical protein